MANTYTQVHIQVVFAVKHRASLIQNAWKDELYKYITAIVQEQGHKLLAVNGMADHVHIFFGMNMKQPLPDLIRLIKANSSLWINKNKTLTQRFEWQDGYGAFSYRKSDVPRVIDYIRNQEIHHRKQTFIDEYSRLLQKFEIDYDDRFVFKTPL